MTFEAGRIYESFSADYTHTIQHAMRRDGQWFKRIHERDPRFGWKWTRWRRSVEPDHAMQTQRMARLPRD